jgi:3-oxoacyl-[acyl-carrier protein] reductase
LDLGLEGRVALIAGGSSGLGLAVAKELAREGAHVAIGARDRDRLASARRSLELVARGRVHTTSVDVTDDAAARRWIDDVAAEFGALHVLVVSGSSPPVGTASRFRIEDYRTAIERNLFPPIRLALAALPHMKAAHWGRILFVTSETANHPVGMLALSGVARAGVVRFAEALASEVGMDGITVNLLAPGATRTEMVERAAAKMASDGDVEAELRSWGSNNAVGRIGRLEEFAAVATFLASERASFVTGRVHLMDGGASVMEELPYLRAAAPKDVFT